jgi:polyisoprenoid-binding protein YceI
MSSTAVEIPGYRTGIWTIDPANSDVAFTARLMTVGKVRGHFTRFRGELVLAADPLASMVTATIESDSIDTNNRRRDHHLRSADFLDVQAHPTMTYRSTGIRHSDHGFVIDGELTLHGVTRQVPLTLDVNGFTRDPYSGARAGFLATAEISRQDFGIGTSIPMGGGSVVIGDRIQISIEIQALLAKPQPAAA